VLVLALEEYEVNASSLHSPFIGIDISSTDETLRSVSIKKILETLEIAEKLGCTHVIVHPSQLKYDTEEDYHSAKRLLARSIEELAKEADGEGLILAVENMLVNPEGLRVGTTVAEIRECLEPLPVTNVGICLDTGHTNHNGLQVSKETRDAGDLLIDLHVNDNDGSGDQHKVPGDGTIDWESFMTALKETGYDGMFTMEIHGRDQPVETLENSYKAALKLLKY